MAEPAAANELEVVNVEGKLIPCSICGRTFLPIPLTKHGRVCERNANRKRKVFNSLKQRVEGTEFAQFHQTSYLKKSHPPKEPKETTTNKLRSKWREQHVELVNTIRAAKGISFEGNMCDSKKPTTAVGSERCPYCDRQFGPKSYDRHVDWCKGHQIKIQKSPADVLAAKERLEARTKYRVPLPNKSKRVLVREKYSPAPKRSESVNSVKSVSSVNLDRSPSLRTPKPVSKATKIGSVKSEISLDGAIATPKLVVEKPKQSAGDSSKSPHPIKVKMNQKLNRIEVNDNVVGMTVSQMTGKEIHMNETKRLVTWKDTVSLHQNISHPDKTPKHISNFTKIKLDKIKTSNDNQQSTSYLNIKQKSNIPVKSISAPDNSNNKELFLLTSKSDTNIKINKSGDSTNKQIKNKNKFADEIKKFNSSISYNDFDSQSVDSNLSLSTKTSDDSIISSNSTTNKQVDSKIETKSDVSNFHLQELFLVQQKFSEVDCNSNSNLVSKTDNSEINLVDSNSFKPVKNEFAVFPILDEVECKNDDDNSIGDQIETFNKRNKVCTKLLSDLKTICSREKYSNKQKIDVKEQNIISLTPVTATNVIANDSGIECVSTDSKCNELPVIQCHTFQRKTSKTENFTETENKELETNKTNNYNINAHCIQLNDSKVTVGDQHKNTFFNSKPNIADDDLKSLSFLSTISETSQADNMSSPEHNKSIVELDNVDGYSIDGFFSTEMLEKDELTDGELSENSVCTIEEIYNEDASANLNFEADKSNNSNDLDDSCDQLDCFVENDVDNISEVDSISNNSNLLNKKNNVELRDNAKSTNVDNVIFIFKSSNSDGSESLYQQKVDISNENCYAIKHFEQLKLKSSSAVWSPRVFSEYSERQAYSESDLLKPILNDQDVEQFHKICKKLHKKSAKNKNQPCIPFKRRKLSEKYESAVNEINVVKDKRIVKSADSVVSNTSNASNELDISPRFLHLLNYLVDENLYSSSIAEEESILPISRYHCKKLMMMQPTLIASLQTGETHLPSIHTKIKSKNKEDCIKYKEMTYVKLPPINVKNNVSKCFATHNLKDSKIDSRLDQPIHLPKITQTSLNRNTPKVRARCTKLTPLLRQDSQVSPASSPVSTTSEKSSIPYDTSNHRLSKFCHECGNKFPIDAAKFCVECGAKRLIF